MAHFERCKSNQAKNMKKLTLLFAAITLSAVLLLHASEKQADKISAAPRSKVVEVETQDPMWIAYGPGIIDSIRSVKFARLVRTEDASGIEEVEVAKAKIPEFKQWSRTSIQPWLGTCPVSKSGVAGSPVYNLLCYSGEHCEEGTMLFAIPLGSFFIWSSVKDYESMVQYWCSTNAPKRTIEPFIKRKAPPSVIETTNTLRATSGSTNKFGLTNAPTVSTNQPPALGR